MTRVHHLDCATMCPLGGARFGQVDRMVGHCLLVEAPGGLVLVDTGFGTADRSRLPTGFRWVARPRLEPERTAIAQVRALGFDPRDVRHVVLTHLDLDHAGGLSDFPEAEVHVRAAELEQAERRPDIRSRLRYVREQWDHGARWRTWRDGGDRWRGFEGVVELPGSSAEIVMIPLGGHSAGHQGVAVAGERGWMLHVGDLWAHRARASGARPPWGIAAFEGMMAHDRALLRENQARARALAGGGEVRVFCAHDEQELRAARAP